jgi:plasmid stabilization system protein ParE
LGTFGIITLDRPDVERQIESCVRSQKAIAVLDDFPFAGRVRDEIRPSLRSVAASPHIVFYRLKDSRPEIVRVLDGRRDIEDIFSDDEAS